MAVRNPNRSFAPVTPSVAPSGRGPGRLVRLLRTVRFQAGHISSWRGSCERYGLLPVAVACGWLLLLLSPLLSARLGPPRSSRRPRPTAIMMTPAATSATPRIPGHADQKGIFPTVYTRQLMVSRPLTAMTVTPPSNQRSDLWLLTFPFVFASAIFHDQSISFLRPYHGNRPVTARTVRGMARARRHPLPSGRCSPTLLGSLPGDTEPGADLDPGVAAGAGP